jgi:hypothetical protein
LSSLSSTTRTTGSIVLPFQFRTAGIVVTGHQPARGAIGLRDYLNHIGQVDRPASVIPV